ncbi:hypothetical protein JZ751_009231, partial [Albula glossodonta]
VVLTQVPGQEVQVELFDKDMDQDDFMGRCKISLGDIIASQFTDQWFTLNDVKSGRVHLVLEWLPTVSEPGRLEPVLAFQSQQSYQNKAVPAAALLFVLMDRAHGLPVCDRSTNPQWDESFYFLVRDPKQDMLTLKLTHTGDQPTGSLVLPMRQILSEPDLVLDRWLRLDGALFESQVLLRAQLKILDTKLSERGVVEDEPVGSADITNMDKDDFLGRFNVPLSDIINSQYTDQWFTLNDVKSGHVHLVLEWLPKATESGRLEPVLEFRSQQAYLNKAVPAAALLFVYIDRAHGLPLKKSGKEPKVGAELVLEGTSHKTKVCDRSTSPQWDEAFYFLVHDPKQETLIVKLTHTGDQPTGSLVLPIRALLSEPDLILDTKMPEHGVAEEELVGAVEERDEAEPALPTREAAPAANQEQEWVSAGRSQRVDEQDPPSATVPPPVTVHGEDEEEMAVEDVPGGVSVTPTPHETRPQHTSPDPSFATEGVLRILLLEARDLIAKDNLMGGLKKGKSDPYVNIHIGSTAFRSRVIKENLNPTWNELYEVVLKPTPGQEVQVELYDKDMDKDDFLGRFKVSLSDIISQYTDQWFTLNDVKSGRVHLVLEWLPKVTDFGRLEPVLEFQSQQAYLNKAVPAAALLFVYMDRAHGLPLKKSGKEPKVGAELVLGENSHRTKVCDRSTAPQWDEAFYFLVHDPRQETLIVKLTHTGDQPTGSLVLPIRVLLSEPDLVLDHWLGLDGVPPESQILLRAELKILDTKMMERGVGEVELVGAADITSSAEEAEPALPSREAAAAANQEQETEEEERPSAPFTVSPPVTLEDEEEPKFVREEISVDPTPPRTHPHQPFQDPGFATEMLDTKLVEREVEEVELVGAADITSSAGEAEPALPSREAAPAANQEDDEEEVAAEVAPPTDTRHQQTSPDPSFAKEARDLVAKDNLMGGLKKGKSDPYVNIHIGSTAFRSRVIKENLNPTWNELYEEVKFELYDKDLDDDDFLGSDIIASQCTDQWFTLKDIKSGRVHLVLEWLPAVSEPGRLEQVLQFQAQQSYQNKAVPSAALLFVFIEGACSLPILETKMAEAGGLGSGAGPWSRAGEQQDRAQIKLSLAYLSKQKKLVVTVHSCRHLAAAGKDVTDPYVSFILSPDKSKATKRKTSTKKKDANLDYNESFDIDISVEELRRRQLDLSVKNTVSFMNRDREVIGKVQLDLSKIDLDSGVTQWYDLKEEAG